MLDACSYPFNSDDGRHWVAAFAVAGGEMHSKASNLRKSPMTCTELGGK